MPNGPTQKFLLCRDFTVNRPLVAVFFTLRMLAAIMLAVVFLGLSSVGSQAQQAATPRHDATSPAISEEALQSLVKTLEDDGKRTEFVDTLKAALAAQQAARQGPQEPNIGAQMVASVSQSLGRVGDQLSTLVRQLGAIPKQVSKMRELLDEPAERQALMIGMAKALAVLLIGTLARLFIRAMLRPLRARVTTGIQISTTWERWPLRGLLAILVLLPSVAMVASAWVVLPMLHANGSVRLAIIGFVVAVALLRAVVALSDVIFYPTNASVRMLPISDLSAAYLMIWIRRIASTAILGYFSVVIAEVLGLAAGSAVMLLKVLALFVATLLIIFILQNRTNVAHALRRGTGTPHQGRSRRLMTQILRQRLADVWHILASLYVGAAFVVWVTEVKGGFLFMAQATAWSVLIVVVAILALQGVSLGLERAFALRPETESRFPGLEKRSNRYSSLVETVARSLIAVLSVLGLLQAWGLDTFAWFSNGLGQRLASGTVTIALVLVLALLVWELASAWIERYFSTTDTDGNLLERSARAHTLLPLARTVLVMVLGVVVILTVLSEIGVNIAPLLAGAGVIGLAVGFGSQKLVQDVITGAFMLIEDTVSVGDVVEAGGHSGLVEGMSIRSMRLRDVSGSVHTIPFSTVDTIVNMTKDFSFYVLNVGVAYREDLDHVYAVLTEVASDLAADPEYGPSILDALDIQGVDQFADSAVIIRARIKTKPIEQWRVGREFNRRMKKAFDIAGIEIPFPHQTIYFGEDRNGKAPPMHVRMDGKNDPVPAPSVVSEEPKAPEMGPPAPSSLTRDMPG
jgi:small conductance mechanosensitive channel